MTDHKYTDEEVIRALECCGRKGNCVGCVFDKIDCGDLCTRKVIQLALDLINRQEAEIKMLTENSISTKYPNHVLCSKGLILTKSLEDYDKLIADISAEAIKEFAERVKAHTAHLFSGVDVRHIVDELVADVTDTNVGSKCTDKDDCSTCEHCYRDGEYNECRTDGVKGV